MKLRPHQDDAIRAYRTARPRSRRILMVAPTGAGKTVISGFLVRDAARQGKRVLVLAPWRVLIPQTVARYSELMNPSSIGVLMAGRKPDVGRQIQVGSIETVRRWMDRLDLKPGLVVVDEAHRAASKTRAEMLDRWQVPHLLLTATPYRKKGGGLGRIADEIVSVASIQELTGAGYLVPAVTYSGDPDRVDAVPIRPDGDYDPGELADVMQRPKLVGDIVTDWQRLARGRPTLAFSCNIAHSHQLRDAFLEEGIAAEHLDGTTGTRARRAILGRLESGETQVVTNCNVLTEGFDQPTISCVVARPTASLGVWVQQAGRGLRIADNKKNCILLDPGGNAHRFGLIDTEWEFTLAGTNTAPTEDEEELELELVTCEVCGAVMPANVRTCPGCNEYDARPRVPVAVEGELEIVMHADTRRDELRKLISVARGTGYGALWAAEQWADRYGRPPGELRRGVLVELRRQAELEERPDRWVADQLAALYR